MKARRSPACRALALALLILTLLTSLTSCRLDDEAAFISTARDLITRSAVLNEIYFGKGIEYDRELGGIGNYYYASEQYLESAGFSSIEELKAKTAEVFSGEYCEIIYQSAFEGVKSDNSIVYARYSNDAVVSNDGARDGKILVNSAYQAYDGMLSYDRSYDLDSLEITKVRRKTVTVTVKVTYSLREGYTDDARLVGTHEKEIVFLRLEGGAFRINSPTY